MKGSKFKHFAREAAVKYYKNLWGSGVAGLCHHMEAELVTHSGCMIIGSPSSACDWLALLYATDSIR